MMYFLIAIQQLIASGTHIIAKSITNDLPAAVVLFFRVSVVSVMYIIWLAIQNQKIKIIEKKDYLVLIVLAIVNIPINQFLFLKSLEYTSAANVALAYALTPAFVYIISVLFFSSKPSKLKNIGIVLAISGTILVLSEKGFSFSEEGLFGDMLALLASFSWAIYTILGRPFSLKYGAIYSTGLAMILGFVFYLPIFALLPVQIVLNDISGFNWVQIAYLGLLTSGLGYAIWYYALTKTDPEKVAVFNNLQPALTAILAYFVLGTEISLTFVIGSVIVIIGVFVTQRG